MLQQLALLLKPKKILEIGVFTGTATVRFFHHCPSLRSVLVLILSCVQLALALLPSVESITALDIEDYLPSFVEPFWKRAGVASKIDFRIAPALESLDELIAAKDQTFDLVFIDADKPGYRAYVENILDGGLLSADGVILAVSSVSLSLFAWTLAVHRSCYSLCVLLTC